MEWPHVWWLMLLPPVADGIATCVMADVITTCGRWNSHVFWYGWCYCYCGRWNSHIGWNVAKVDLITLVADGKATGSNYFNLSSLLFIRTSSHIWGRWYLPMFLLRYGLLTLMNIDSLISLGRFCSSLPTMLKFWGSMTCGVTVVMNYTISQSIISGNSICHNSNNINHPHKVAVPSATVETSSAISQSGYSISTMTITSVINKNVAIPSATMTIPSAISQNGHK